RLLTASITIITTNPPNRSMNRGRTKELGCKQECYNSICRGSEDCGHLGREFSETDGECKQKRKRCGNRFSHAARVDVVLHHFHSARNRSADAIQRDTRHGAKKNR